MPLSNKYLHEGHRLGQAATTGPYTFASGPGGTARFRRTSTGSADFIPGSGYPGVAAYQYLNRISNWNSYVAGADMSAFLASGRTATNGLYCASCHSPHGIVRGNSLPLGLTKGKLLSSRPNHRQTPISTTGWTSWVASGYNWCETCHIYRSEPNTPEGMAPHNHPSQFCIECHGDNPAAALDFPHTGAPNLVSANPDELCVSSCHAFGLP